MTTSLVDYAIRILTDEQNSGRKYTARVCTKQNEGYGTVKGFSHDADVLWLLHQNGNDILIPGSDVLLIEINWEDGKPSADMQTEEDNEDW
jgi:hypothetical protein